MRCVLTVLGRDRSGIVAAVSSVLADCHANIDDIQQTILEGIFSMTMLVTLNTDVASFNDTQEKLKEVGEKLGVQVMLQRQELFDSMYNI